MKALYVLLVLLAAAPAYAQPYRGGPVTHGYKADEAPGWVDYEVRDVFNLRAGTVRYHPVKDEYLFFDRYGKLQGSARLAPGADRYLIFNALGEEIASVRVPRERPRPYPHLITGYPELFRSEYDDFWQWLDREGR